MPLLDVSVGLNTDEGCVYEGTELIISCTITIDPAVYTNVEIIFTWSIQDFGSGSVSRELVDREFLTISDTTNSDDMFYTSTVTIRPVKFTDSSSYICSASLVTDDIITFSDEANETVDIIVKGMCHLSLLVVWKK